MKINKRFCLAIVPVIFALLAYYLYFNEALTTEVLRNILSRWHRFAPIIFVGMHLLRPISLLPTSLLVFLAGVYFPFWTGLILSLTGVIAGMGIAYKIANYLGYNWLIDKYPQSKGLLTTLQNCGWPFVAMLRLIPVFPADVVSYACGTCKIPFRSYVFGSLIGSLPGTIVLISMGKGLRTGEYMILLPMIITLGLVSYYAWKRVRLVIVDPPS